MWGHYFYQYYCTNLCSFLKLSIFLSHTHDDTETMDTELTNIVSIIFTFDHKMHNSINLFGIKEAYSHQFEIRLYPIIKLCQNGWIRNILNKKTCIFARESCSKHRKCLIDTKMLMLSRFLVTPNLASLNNIFAKKNCNKTFYDGPWDSVLLLKWIRLKNWAIIKFQFMSAHIIIMHSASWRFSVESRCLLISCFHRYYIGKQMSGEYDLNMETESNACVADWI